MAEQQTSKFIWDDPHSEYFTTLRQEFELNALLDKSPSEYELVKRVCAWCYAQFQHDSWNVVGASDPLSILRQAKEGASLRCVEFSIAAAGVLIALGQSARVLYLKTQDVETRESGAGHVVVEAFMRTAHKWMFCDPQFNAIPLYKGTILNGYELRNLIHQDNSELELSAGSGTPAQEYFSWIAPYLFYFDVALDQRLSVVGASERRLMLVPPGACKPRVFQRVYPLVNVLFTENANSFYSEPPPG